MGSPREKIECGLPEREIRVWISRKGKQDVDFPRDQTGCELLERENRVWKPFKIPSGSPRGKTGCENLLKILRENPDGKA